MKHPKFNNSAQFIKIDSNQIITSLNTPAHKVSPKFKAMIIDLKMKDLSYREIVDHMTKFFDIALNISDIPAIIQEAGNRAKYLNHFYDSIAIPKIKVLEVDEVFQGRVNCFLGAADKETSYLAYLNFLENRSSNEISSHLTQIEQKVEDLQLIITDGLKAYPEAISSAFEDIIHLECQVHGMRTIYKKQEEYKRDAKKAWNTLQNTNKKLDKAKKTLFMKRKELRNKNRQLNRTIASRDRYYKQQEIQPYSKKAEWTIKRIKYKTKLNHYRTAIRSKKRTITNVKNRILRLKHEVKEKNQNFRLKQQINLQSGRLVKRFKRLLFCNSSRFDEEKRRFEAILKQSKYSIAKTLLKFLNDHPKLFSLQKYEIDDILGANFRNTNTIERVFGIFRNFLKKIRHITRNENGYALLEILRFKYNMTPPKTGIHNHESPLQRLNIHSKYDTYLNALFPSMQDSKFMEINLWQNGLRNDHLVSRSVSATKIEVKR